MATTVVSTIASSGGDYTSLQSWYNDRKGNLVTRDTVEVAEIAGETLSGGLTMDSQTTDSTRYFKITAASGAEFKGDFGSLSGVARISVNTPTNIIDLFNQYTILENICIDGQDSGASGSGKAINLNSNNITVRNVGVFKMKYTLSGSVVQIQGINVGFRESCKVYNCVVDGVWANYTGTKSGSAAYGISITGGADSIAYNNTILNTKCTAGGGNSTAYGLLFYGTSGHNAIAKNNFVGLTTASGGTATDKDFFSNSSSYITQDHNASEDSTATGTGSLTTRTVANEVITSTTSSVNAHLQSGSTLIDAGTDLSGTFTTDIDGQTRSGTWDIGADEFFSSGLTINVSDNITLTESVDVLRNHSRDLSVNDTITITESIARLVTDFINVNDVITLTESVTVSIEAGATLTINVNDSITLTESIIVLNPLDSTSVFEAVTITESVSLIVSPLHINLNDSITVTEEVTTRVDLNISVNDTVNLTEFTNVNRIYLISVNDTITPTEVVTVQRIFLIQVDDSITLTESNTTSNPLDAISISDSIDLTESVTVQISQEGILNITVSESVTLTESISVANSQLGDINISDAITLTENIAGITSIGDISLSEEIVINEILSVANNLLPINCSDNITINENTQFSVDTNISVQDIVVTTENLIVVNTNLGGVNVFEVISVEEDTSLNAVGQIYLINVNDIVSLTEVSTINRQVLSNIILTLTSKINSSLKVVSKIK